MTSYDLSGDRPVTVASADRVIAVDISGSITATVAGLGLLDTLVARDISTTFDEAAGLPVITSSAHTVNSEEILAMRPDLVLTDGSIGPIDVVVQLPGTSGVYYLFGQESGSDVLIGALGGVDVAAETGLEGMRPMTDEAMVDGEILSFGPRTVMVLDALARAIYAPSSGS